MSDLTKGRANSRDIPLLSLFSGPGGLDIGFEQAGFDPILALDSDPVAVSTYNHNRATKNAPAAVADLAEQSPQAVLQQWQDRAGLDVTPVGIIGGPPCQAFSVSNVYRLADDPRAQLPLSYARILQRFNEHFGLHFFLFENVAGLGNRPHSSSLSLFIEQFEGAGFRVKPFYLDAAEFGLPQYRKRMFIAGFNSSLYRNLDYQPPVGDGPFVSVRDAIGHLPEPIRFTRGCDPRKSGMHPNHWCLSPKSRKFTDGSLKPGKMLGRSFRMLEWDERSWTVAYGHREVHVHPNGERRLSMYEAMLLQGFPEDYELLGTLSDQIRQVSDAVPPPLAHALAESISNALQLPSPALEAAAHTSSNGHTGHLGLFGVQTVAPRSTRA